MLKFTQFCNSKELQEKSTFLNIAAQALETGDFLTFSQSFRVFEAHFLIKSFLMKKNVYCFCGYCTPYPRNVLSKS